MPGKIHKNEKGQAMGLYRVYLKVNQIGQLIGITFKGNANKLADLVGFKNIFLVHEKIDGTPEK